MSNERLLRMYSEELEYLCGKFRNHHVYCYPKDALFDYRSRVAPAFIEAGYEWTGKKPGMKEYVCREIDLGLLLVHVIEKEEGYEREWETRRFACLNHPKKPRVKRKQEFFYHEFEVSRLSNVSAVSMFVGCTDD
jgi:hypothetical protein